MGKIKILEGNKLMAHFAGFIPCNDPMLPNREKLLIHPITGKYVNVNELLYHFSWDWLNQVINKIGTLFPCMKTHSYYQGTYYEYSIEIPKQLKLLDGCNIRAIGDTMIESTWMAVVEFIKWYNKYQEYETPVC